MAIWIIIFVSVILYSLSYWMFKTGRNSMCLAFIIAGGLLLRIYASSDGYLHPWDERFHALVAKNLIEQPLKPMLYKEPLLEYDYKAWNSNHIWLHKQPLPLWLMAASLYVFGINIFAVRLPSILLSTLGIFIMYLTGSKWFNKRIGLISAFLYSIHGLIIELTAGKVATDHIDVVFLVFIQLAVWFAIRFFENKSHINNVLCGLFIGAAILSKWLPALIVLPIWWIISFEKGNKITWQVMKYFLILCLTVCVVALPWQIYIHVFFPIEAAWERNYNLQHITNVLGDHAHPVYYHFDRMRLHYGELIYIPVIWLIWHLYKQTDRFRLWILATWIFIPYLFFTVVKTKMQAYTILSAPALFILTALFFIWLNANQSKFGYRWLTNLVLILMIALPVRYSLERLKPFNQAQRPEWSSEIESLKNALPKSEKIVLFNTKYPVETMFSIDCVAYEGVPDQTTLLRIKKSGYKIYQRTEFTSDKSNKAGQDILLNGFVVVYKAL